MKSKLICEDLKSVLKEAGRMGCKEIKAFTHIPLENVEIIISSLEKTSDDEKIKKISQHYGFSQQSMMMIEECSELQQSICKWKREHRYVKNTETYHCKERTAIIEELADVIIMTKQLSYLLSAEDEVSEQIEFKLDRQLRRMEEENAHSVTE